MHEEGVSIINRRLPCSLTETKRRNCHRPPRYATGNNNAFRCLATWSRSQKLFLLLQNSLYADHSRYLISFTERRRCICVITRAHYWFLSWARLISPLPNTIHLLNNIHHNIVVLYMFLGLPTVVILPGFQAKLLCTCIIKSKNFEAPHHANSSKLLLLPRA